MTDLLDKSSPIYKESHCKVDKVILLWWGGRFWFLLIFWILHLHEIHMAIYASFISCYWNDDLCHLWSKMQTSKKRLMGKEFKCTYCKKLFSNLCFKVFWPFFDAFLFLDIQIKITIYPFASALLFIAWNWSLKLQKIF